MANDPNKVIYSMIGVSKVYEKKPVLKDIYLSYFYGAKIGVLGLNGSGKSSLLRILAGVDQDFIGKTILSPGHTVGSSNRSRDWTIRKPSAKSSSRGSRRRSISSMNSTKSTRNSPSRWTTRR
jgi:ATPase subunit of ABC transporter with duplicated ATPase domains